MNAQTELSYQMEIDRLRAELEEAKQYITWHREAIAEGLGYLKEVDRLRTENIDFWKAITLIEQRSECAWTRLHCRAVLAKTAKAALAAQNDDSTAQDET